MRQTWPADPRREELESNGLDKAGGKDGPANAERRGEEGEKPGAKKRVAEDSEEEEPEEAEEIETQGFVTVKHSFDDIKKLKILSNIAS